jgi:predicted NBD/HSP70 family sugar kinase
MESSLFLKVSSENYTDKVRDIFLRIRKELGDIPMAAANDGDVAALLGAMELNLKNLLGISLGTSVAGGYVDTLGKVNGKLNELAFMPVDYNRAAPIDPWSGDYGCGVNYLSQDAAIRLAEQVGIEFSDKASSAERFKYIHKLLKEDDIRAKKIYETIGAYLGYSIANYSQFYSLNNVMLSGGVTSGEGGEIILQTAQQVLKLNFPNLYSSIKLHLPVEDQRGLGQAIAAASLPSFKR